MKSNYSALPNRIRRIRIAQNLSQEVVTERLNISASAYGQIERNANKASYETLLKISFALNVKITNLINTDEIK